MDWHVIVDNEWFYTGTFEQCCDCANNIASAFDEYGGCGHSVTMVSDEEFYGYKED